MAFSVGVDDVCIIRRHATFAGGYNLSEYNDAVKFAALVIYGKIEEGDDEKFKGAILAELRRGYWVGRVHLMSTGGSVNAALNIGEQIRTLRSVTRAPSVSGTGYRECSTQMPPYRNIGYYTQDVWREGRLIARRGTGDENCECVSACFLIWAAGIGREGNVVGVHAIRFTAASFGQLKVEDARQLYNTQVARISKYLQVMGMPEHTIGLMWSNSSSEMRYLTREELEVFPRFEPVIEEIKLARCGEHPGSRNPPEVLEPYYKCVNGIHEETVREGARDYLTKYGP